MKIAQDTEVLKGEFGTSLPPELREFVERAAQEGMPMHEVERGVWDRVLRMGHDAVQHFVNLQGTGDMGPTVTLPDGHTVRRLDETHTRAFKSIFGDFQIERVVYGTREGQKIEFVPLDTRLSLPENNSSYVLQDWDGMLEVEHPFGKVSEVLQKILRVEQHVDSLERVNRQMAGLVDAFVDTQPTPAPAEEGAIVVISADHKGVPMRRPAEQAAIERHASAPGPKPGQKKMATLGAMYTVDSFVRTPEQVVESLFRRPGEQPESQPKRPKPCHKQARARLSYRDETGVQCSGTDLVFGWLAQQLERRNPGQAKPTVYLMDGEKELWITRQGMLPDANAVEVLDLLHVTSRLWQAAQLFCAVGSDAAEAFVRDRVLRVLRGAVVGVIAGLRQMGTKHGLRGSRRKTLQTICGYFAKNRQRMRYDEYLAAGYPIASGVIEGACRHVVKDRMERTGMRWVLEGAQAMLDLRTTYLNGQWDAFQAYRIERETERLHPHRSLIETTPWALAA